MPGSGDPRDYAPLLSGGELRQANVDERQVAVILLDLMKPIGDLQTALQRIIAGELVPEFAFIELRRLGHEAALQLVRDRDK
jgi:hypothetical protein